MSTTIYNGYKLPMMSFRELTEFTKRFREMAKEKTVELVSAYIAEKITELLDDMRIWDEEMFVERHVLYEDELEKLIKQRNLEKQGVVLNEEEKIKLRLDAYPHRTAKSVVVWKARERYRKIEQTMTRDPVVDFDSNACFIPIQDKILVLFNCEQKEIVELWESLPEITYYGYWNNTDPDKSVSEEEWEQRRKDWNEALPGAGVLMDNGMFAYFVKDVFNPLMIEVQLVMKFIPSFEKRVNRVAKDIVMDRKFKELISANENKMNALWETIDWLKTDEGKEEVKKEKERVAPLLIPVITKEHLFTPMHELK